MTLWARPLDGVNSKFGTWPWSLDNPSPGIQTVGLGGRFHSSYEIIDDGQPMTTATTDKPPFSVPTMAQIESIPWNGFCVASTFSGAGGSCLGYRMAGYRVVWANEFVPMAQKSYRAKAIRDGVLT